MDSNETNRPLTEVPMDKTPETLVSSPAQAEENNTMYVPKQTKEEVIKTSKRTQRRCLQCRQTRVGFAETNFL